MDDWGLFWVGLGLAVGMMFVGQGLTHLGESIARSTDRYVDFMLWLNADEDDDEEG